MMPDLIAMSERELWALVRTLPDGPQLEAVRDEFRRRIDEGFDEPPPPVEKMCDHDLVEEWFELIQSLQPSDRRDEVRAEILRRMAGGAR